MNIYHQRFKTPEQRFWEKVNKNGRQMPHVPELGNCWEWTGNKPKALYGQFQAEKTIWQSHRFSWRLHFREIPDGLWVLHKCDNPSCVNPNHLFLGTAKDNSIDREIKNRGNHLFGNDNPSRKHPENLPRGSSHKRSKLTEKIVVKIRQENQNGTKQKLLAKKYCISKAMVCMIVNWKNWTHI